MTKTQSSSSSSNNDTEELDWFLRGRLPVDVQQHADLASKQTSPAPTTSSIMEHLDHSSCEAFHNGIKYNSESNTDDGQIGHVLSRSISLPAAPTPTKKKSGFLRNLFSKSKNSIPTNTPSPSPSPRPSTSPSQQNRKSNSNENLARTRSLSMSASSSTLDPKLDEFFKYYRSKGFEKLQYDLDPYCKSHTNSIADITSTEKPPTSKKTDALGRPIPPHPKKSPLPSSLVKNHHHDKCVKDQMKHTNCQLQQQQAQSSKLGFLRRSNTTESKPGSAASSIKSLPASTKSSTKLEPVVIPGLENLPILKRVAFDFPVFYNDPPQQIPSRTPRKGEVEILGDGTIVIHKLTFEERKKIMASSQGGIVVGGSGPLKILTKEQRQAIEKREIQNTTEKETPPVIDTNLLSNNTPTDKNASSSEKPKTEKKSTPTTVKIETDSDTASDTESDSDSDQDVKESGLNHSLKVAASAAAASSRGREAPNDLKRTVTNHEEEVIVNSEATKINIDKPMARHNKSYTSMSNVSIQSNDFEEKVNKRELAIPLDVLYTRCCHLREILPIPATVKQLKAGSTDPIPLLQMRNPKPSLVEVLTFSDFISVAPILCISLDGVSLSSEMFRIILSSLAHKKELEKLTLRNTPIDELGWRLLCWFLTKNKTLSRIDLTQVSSLATNVQKPSKSAVTSTIVRMECDKNSRSDMNWNLFNAALISRNGIDELVINGAKIPVEQFKNLIEMGIQLSTTKLGLAYNELTAEHVELLAKNLDFKKILGLDLGYNDLSGKLKYFIEVTSFETFTASNLKFISFNSANLSGKDDEIKTFVSGFAKLKDLKYIDLSNNKKLFPNLINTLAQNLPLFPRLARIHFDYNDLNQNFLVSLAELIPFCHSLSHVSLIGNKIDSISGSALASAMKKSHSMITLDLDYDDLPHEIKEEITLYSVRNMKNQVYHDDQNGSSKELLSLQNELSNLLREKDGSEPELFDSFVTRATNIRKKIHETIDELFSLRVQGKLNVEGKETLIRFCFIDSSIENGLKLLKEKTPHLKLDKVFDLKNGRSSSSGGNKFVGSYVTSQGHGELLPFSVGTPDMDEEQDPEELNEIPKEITDSSETGRSVDDSKLKEEASLLKIGSFIKKNDLTRALSEDHLQTLKAMSGDDIREVMLKTNNVENLVDVLDDMKAKGIQLGDIYKKQDDMNGVDNKDSLYFETKSNTNTNIGSTRKVVDDHADKKDDLDNFSSDSNSIASNDDGLGQAFDEILDEIVRVRTNS